jgi:hypothetical protein
MTGLGLRSVIGNPLLPSTLARVLSISKTKTVFGVAGTIGEGVDGGVIGVGILGIGTGDGGKMGSDGNDIGIEGIVTLF